MHCGDVDAHFRSMWADEVSDFKKRDYYVRAKAALENSGISSPSRALNTQLGVPGKTRNYAVVVYSTMRKALIATIK